MHNLTFKTITYRGGIVRFRIPANWKEEFEEAGGGTFYAPVEDSGTLRLNVVTASAPTDKPLTNQIPAELLAGPAARYGVAVTPLREGISMVCYDLEDNERGQPISIRCWQVAQSLPPKNARVAMFTYTLLRQQFLDRAFVAELEMLDREIRAAEFAPIVGMTR
jgi:hypothetical protein